MGDINYVDARWHSLLEISDAARVRHAQEVAAKLELLPPAPAIVHLKGFTSGMKASDLGIIGNAIVTLLRRQGIDTLVWDGDDWAPDSFTGILPLVREQLPQIKFVAFLRAIEQHDRYNNPAGFHGSWRSTNVASSLTVLLLDDGIGSHDRYEHLGLVALRTTMAPLVIAIGGGGTLRKEHDLMNCSDDGHCVKYALFDAVRVKHDAEEHSSLLGVKGIQVHSVQGLSNKSAAKAMGQLHVYLKIMKVFKINDMEQTFEVLLFVQLKWDGPRSAAAQDTGHGGAEPWLEWRNCLSWEEPDGKPPTRTQSVGGRPWKERTHAKVRATFLQPFDLHEYPFDAHKLEMVLVSNAVTDIVMCKPADLHEAATMHKHAIDIIQNSSWSIVYPSEAKHPAVAFFDGTPCNESESRTSYARMSARLCVMRRAEFTLLNVVVPNFLLTICQLFSFAIPINDFGDRLSLYVTVLLAMFAGKLITVGMLPAVAYLTFLDWYILASYLFVVMVAFLVSVTRLVVNMPPPVDLSDDEQTAIDVAMFYASCCVWLLYHLAFIVAGVRLKGRNRLRMLAWLNEAISEQNRESFFRTPEQQGKL